ncbi:hypothetical protein HPY86_03940 [candidate division WOR-3 bacterium]|nr:hypothetical protein [candidate division WOR-3 bacterium]
MKRPLFFLALLLVASQAEWVSIGPDGGYIQILTIDPQSPNRLLAIPYEGRDTPRVFVTVDSGAHWQTLSRFGDIYPLALAIDPYQSNRVYALNGGGNLLLSTDSGVSWYLGSLPGLNLTLKPDPHRAGRLLVGGYDVVNGNYLPAIHISTDFGAHWLRVIPDSTAFNQQALCIEFDPAVRDVVWVGCSNSLIYRSTDGGVTWERRCSGLPANASIQALSVNPDNSDLVLAATAFGLYRTTNAGMTWQSAGVTRATVVQFPLTDGAIGYALGYDSLTQSYRLFVSHDSGATWRGAQPGITLDKGGGLIADPLVPNRAYIYSPKGVFWTNDGGNNWSERHSGMRFARISTISVSPSDSSRLYLEFYENGIFKSLDGGNTWRRCSDFLACGNICGIGIATSTNTDILYALEGKG